MDLSQAGYEGIDSIFPSNIPVSLQSRKSFRIMIGEVIAIYTVKLKSFLAF